jgi:hypothetical protein
VGACNPVQFHRAHCDGAAKRKTQGA